MTKLWRTLPHFVRWLLVTLLIMAVIGGGIYAYVVLTATVEVTVTECVSFVGESTFSVHLYPQESESVSLTVANASSLPIEVDLKSTTPKGGVTVTMPAQITVPATGQVTIAIDITADRDAVPDTYSVTIEFERKK